MFKPNSVQLHHLLEGHLQLHRLQGGGAAAHRHVLQHLHRRQDHLREKVRSNEESDERRWKMRGGQKRHLLRLLAAVVFGDAPERFALRRLSPPAVDHVAGHAHIQAAAQLVQDALGQAGLGLIRHGAGTRQRHQGQAGLGVQNRAAEVGPDGRNAESLDLM
ncbi:hypothetical protein EYF80_035517 [Liparis tanakae]|uniref:Uncharacterized protein n=1 Tax=Liparis tanakae TaxID=230148 RepID=A0A4Z2GLT1_9TELE|nr:hypothetical protein EYF80_035517 [Liparis tanakae]